MRTALLAVAAALTLATTASAQAARRPTTPPRRTPTPATAPKAGAAASPADTLVEARGTVYDSLAGAVLEGAAVQLMSARDQARVITATTDSSGSFRVPRVPPGLYFATFLHPSVEVLGIEAPIRPVTVSAGSSIDLSLPGATRLFALLCPGGPPGDSVGGLVGRVHDADTDAGIGAAKIVVTWQANGLSSGSLRPVLRRIPVTPRPDGSYLICGLPSSADIEVDASAPRRRGGVVDGSVPYRAMRRQDFALGDSASAVATVRTVTDAQGRPQDAETLLRGTARVIGSVRTKVGQPVVGARVTVPGTSSTAVTQADGSFALAGLPAGTYSLEARAIGFEPRSVAVSLASARTANARVVMDTRVQTLAAVKVTGKRTRAARDLDLFDERRTRGQGYFVTAADIVRSSPISTTSLLRMAPGMQVSPTSGNSYAVRGRGGCRPTVVVDGLPVSDGADDLDQFVRPSEIGGMEVYNSAVGVPVQYGSNACGAVLIWTKR